MSPQFPVTTLVSDGHIFHSLSDILPVTKDSLYWPVLCLDSAAAMDSSLVEGGLNVTLTIRLLMHGKVSATACNV